MNTSHVYAVVRGSQELERARLKTEFSKFGVVQKLFVNASQNYAKVYFDNEESVKEACIHLNGKNSWTVQYLKHSHNNNHKNDKKDNETEDNISNSSFDNMNDYDVDNIYVDCHGRAVEVLEGDNGKLYVSLDDVRKAGFEVLPKETYENAVLSKENDLKQFMNFMLNQGMRYALKYKKTFDEKEVCTTFEKVKGMLERKSQSNGNNNKIDSDRTINIAGNSKNVTVSKNNSTETDPVANGLHQGKSSKHRAEPRNKTRVALNQNNNYKNRNTSRNRDGNTLLKRPMENIRLEVGTVCKVKVVSFKSDKKTIFYAQLIDNQPLIDEMTTKINSNDCKNDEIKKPQLQTICIAYYNNSWYRARVLQISGRQITVKLIDFGKIVTVNVPVRFLSENSRWPSQAIKMTLTFREVSVIKEGDILDVEVKKLYDDSTLVFIKNVLDSNDINVSNNCQAATVNVPNSEPCFTQIPPDSVELKSNESVIIIGFSNDSLILRNKICAEVTKSLYTYLSTFVLVPINNPKVGQIVLARKEEFDGVHRAVLKKITDDLAEIEYIDYWGSSTVPLKSLQHVDEYIMSKSCCKIVSPKYPRLKELDEKCVAFLKELITKKTKLKMVLEDSHFDLLYNSGSSSVPLSQKLDELKQIPNASVIPEPKQEEEKVEPVVSEKASPDNKNVKLPTLSDMGYVKLEKGRDMYLCYSCTGRSITLLKTTEDSVGYIAELEKLSNIEDNEPFVPEVEQMCLAKYSDSWYRATVLDRNPDGKTFEMLYVDYGNINTVPKELVRKLPEKFTSIPILGVSAYFMGIPSSQKVYDRLKELLPDDSIFEVDVKLDINDDFEYGIEIPSIYNKLKEETLL